MYIFVSSEGKGPEEFTYKGLHLGWDNLGLVFTLDILGHDIAGDGPKNSGSGDTIPAQTAGSVNAS